MHLSISVSIVVDIRTKRRSSILTQKGVRFIRGRRTSNVHKDQGFTSFEKNKNEHCVYVEIRQDENAFDKLLRKIKEFFIVEDKKRRDGVRRNSVRREKNDKMTTNCRRFWSRDDGWEHTTIVDCLCSGNKVIRLFVSCAKRRKCWSAQSNSSD